MGKEQLRKSFGGSRSFFYLCIDDFVANDYQFVACGGLAILVSPLSLEGKISLLPLLFACC